MSTLQSHPYIRHSNQKKKKISTTWDCDDFGLENELYRTKSHPPHSFIDAFCNKEITNGNGNTLQNWKWQIGNGKMCKFENVFCYLKLDLSMKIEFDTSWMRAKNCIDNDNQIPEKISFEIPTKLNRTRSALNARTYDTNSLNLRAFLLFQLCVYSIQKLFNIILIKFGCMNDRIPMRITIPFDRWVILSCFRYNNPPIRVLMPIIFLIIAQRLKVWVRYKTMIIRSCSLANKRRIKNDTVCHLCLLPSLFIFFSFTLLAYMSISGTVFHCIRSQGKYCNWLFAMPFFQDK